MVDGLEREYRGKALVLRADIRSHAGRTLSRRYGVVAVPGFLVFDRDGEVVYRHAGATVPVAEIRRALSRARS